MAVEYTHEIAVDAATDNCYLTSLDIGGNYLHFSDPLFKINLPFFKIPLKLPFTFFELHEGVSVTSDPSSYEFTVDRNHIFFVGYHAKLVSSHLLLPLTSSCE